MREHVRTNIFAASAGLGPAAHEFLLSCDRRRERKIK